MNTAPVVMAVDHEPEVLRLIRHELSGRGFRVLTLHRGAEALRTAGTERPDLMLVDAETTDLPGLEVVRRLRERTSAPIIMLSQHRRDKERALALGASDFLDKPFSGGELAERVRSALRHVAGGWTGEHVVRVDDVAVDLNRRTVARGGEIVALTRTEWLILEHLARHQGLVVASGELASAVWGARSFGAAPNVRVWMSRLRRKLEADPTRPRLLITARRRGYMLAASSDERLTP